MDHNGGKRPGPGGAEGGTKGGNTGGHSSKGQGEASSSVKPGGDDEVMKAPGAEGYISREAFERNPQGYFQGLHHVDKGGK